MKRIFIIIKYKIIRFIEQFPSISFFILNNLRFFKFLLPHDKDFLGLKLLCNNNYDFQILDIGSNIGSSILSFRSLGFKNKIYVFEPNKLIVNKYIQRLKLKDPDIEIFNYALGNENVTKPFFVPYYKGICLHTYSSFDKKFLINGLKNSLPKLTFLIKQEKIDIKKYDDLNLDIYPYIIKIDTEGYELPVIQGMLKNIKVHKPIILMEYNNEKFRKIKNLLKEHDPFSYNVTSNDFHKLNINETYNLRNIYFIPKNFLW